MKEKKMKNKGKIKEKGKKVRKEEEEGRRKGIQPQCEVKNDGAWR